MLLCCYFYIYIFIFILLHSLLIIPCIIFYVTNKETLNLECASFTVEQQTLTLFCCSLILKPLLFTRVCFYPVRANAQFEVLSFFGLVFEVHELA